MRRAPAVDREVELGLFARMAAGQTQERVLLIRAESGIGKSELLREFTRRRPPHGLYAVLDFKNGDIPDLAELFSRLFARLGAEHFPHLISQILQFLHPTSITISGNTVLGKAEIAAALSAPDEDARRFHRAALTDAFLQDLRANGSVILVFDTFNDCDPVLAQWLSGFLARACDTRNLMVVVAGQRVPEPSLEWEAYCQALPLGPIAAVHWHQYAQNIGVNLDVDMIRRCWEACHGHSLKIAQILETFAPRESGA